MRQWFHGSGKIGNIDEYLKRKNIARRAEALTHKQVEAVLSSPQRFRTEVLGSKDGRGFSGSPEAFPWGYDSRLSRPIAGEGVTPDVFRADRKLRIAELV